jgi:hypothetical protein
LVSRGGDSDGQRGIGAGDHYLKPSDAALPRVTGAGMNVDTGTWSMAA